MIFPARSRWNFSVSCLRVCLAGSRPFLVVSNLLSCRLCSNYLLSLAFLFPLDLALVPLLLCLFCLIVIPNCLPGALSTGSIELHVDDGIIVLITLSSCLRVISDSSLLLSPSLSSVFSSKFCVFMLLVSTSLFGSCVHSCCLLGTPLCYKMVPGLAGTLALLPCFLLALGIHNVFVPQCF